MEGKEIEVEITLRNYNKKDWIEFYTKNQRCCCTEVVSLTSAPQVSNLYSMNQSKYSLSHLRQEKQDYYNTFKLEKTNSSIFPLLLLHESYSLIQ